MNENAPTLDARCAQNMLPHSFLPHFRSKIDKTWKKLEKKTLKELQ